MIVNNVRQIGELDKREKNKTGVYLCTGWLIFQQCLTHEHMLMKTKIISGTKCEPN